MKTRATKLEWMGSAAALAGVIAAGTVAGRPMARQEIGAAAQSNAGAKSMNEPSGFYCNLKALSPEERQRHHELTMKLAEARLDTKELADGYAFRLGGEMVSVAELAEWVTAERKCCPFFDFEIEAERDGGPLWLKLRGRDGVKAFIQSEFRIA